MSRAVLGALTLTLLTLDLPAGRAGYGGSPGSETSVVVHALAKVQGDRILIRQYPMVSVNEMRTTIRVVKDGKAQEIVSPNYMVVKTFPKEMLSQADVGKVQALDADGRTVGPEALAERLRKETHVLLSYGTQEIDPAYRQLLKKGTLVLIVPKDELGHGGTKEEPPRPKRTEGGPGTSAGSKPQGVQPTVASARITDQAMIQFQTIFGKTVVETAYRETEKDGRREKTPVQVKYVYFSLQTQSLDSTAVQAFGTDGKAMAQDALARLLKKSTPVVLSADGKRVDPFYLEIIQEGTLVLVLPIPESAYGYSERRSPAPLPVKPDKKTDNDKTPGS